MRILKREYSYSAIIGFIVFDTVSRTGIGYPQGSVGRRGTLYLQLVNPHPFPDGQFVEGRRDASRRPAAQDRPTGAGHSGGESLRGKTAVEVGVPAVTDTVPNLSEADVAGKE